MSKHQPTEREIRSYEKVTIELSPQAIRLAERLHRTGLFGLTRQEVLERFICDRLRDYVDFKLELR